MTQINLNGQAKVLVARLLEAGIIGCIVLYGTIRVIGNDIENLKDDVAAVKQDIKDIRDDFYVPRGRSQSSVYNNHPALAKWIDK